IYAISAHNFGVIDAATGKFSVFPIDPNLPQLSWPGGLAFDLKNRRVIVAGQMNGFALDLASGKWAMIPSFADLRLCGLTYSPLRNVLFGLMDDPGSESIKKLLEMTPDGAVLRNIRLSPPIPAAPFGGRAIQFLSNGLKLLVIVPGPHERSGAKNSPAPPD